MTATARRSWLMGGVAYPYFQPLAFTERDIELAWAREIFAQNRSATVLEVGNSTQRYIGGPYRDIVDRYDPLGGGNPVQREDIVDWQPDHDYGLILSISTLEHVGWEEPEEKDAFKAITAVLHLLDLLAPGGTLAFTIPTGYHERLASWVAAEDWTDIRLMERVSDDGIWEERPLAEFEPQEFPGEWGWNARKVLFVRHVLPGGRGNPIAVHVEGE